MINELTVDAECRLVKLRLSGHLDQQEIWNARSDVVGLMKENGVRNVLIDVRDLDRMISIIDIYEFSVPERDFFPPGTKIAALTKKNDADPRECALMENVHNGGFDFKTFVKVSEAMKWLYDSR
ncbi:MAG: hypothetical protein PHH61_00035 [Candidatus Nanoarchaeia archaeon]|nr:hypothetical protein [Candidatus Nanoarchaeia archaeon]